MNNKKYIALATLLAAGSANAAVVYDTEGTSFAVGGRVQASLYSASAIGESAIKGAARLSTDGKNKIAEGVKALAHGEWDIASSTSTNGNFGTREAYVGFETDNYGKLVFGQTNTAIYNVLNKTDIFEEWGGQGNTYWRKGGRHEGQAVYSYKNKNGFSFGASGQTAYTRPVYGNGSVKGGESVDVKGGGALSVGYTFDSALPLEIQAGTDFYEIQGKDNNESSYAASVTLGTLGDGFYGSSIYQHTRVDGNAYSNGWEVLAGYSFEKVGLLAAWNALDFTGDDHQPDLNRLYFQLSYNIAPNVLAYGEVVIGLSGKNTTIQSNSDLAVVALRYLF